MILPFPQEGPVSAKPFFNATGGACLCLVLFLVWTPYVVPAQVNIIFDTDIGSDCDDAGAMAVLHKLADKGEVNILGVIFSSNKNRYGVGLCDAINSYYGRGDLPLGLYNGPPVGDSLDHYCREIAIAKDTYHHDVVDSAAGLVTAYKDILERQPDASVTIVTVGHAHGLFFLLKDPAGAVLIHRKVKRWVAMAYAGDMPVKDWNFCSNGAAPYTGKLLEEWPTPLYISDAGKDVITGNRKLPSAPRDNPVRKAYELWNNALTTGRSSWDQVAVLFAARPQYFVIDSLGALEMTSKSRVSWNPLARGRGHHRVTPKADLAETIEALMSEAPARTGN